MEGEGGKVRGKEMVLVCVRAERCLALGACHWHHAVIVLAKKVGQADRSVQAV